jgi:hypothetical protein
VLGVALGQMVQWQLVEPWTQALQGRTARSKRMISRPPPWHVLLGIEGQAARLTTPNYGALEGEGVAGNRWPFLVCTVALSRCTKVCTRMGTQTARSPG